MPIKVTDARVLGRKVETVSPLFKSLANPHRLLMMCRLAEFGEMRLGDLALAVGLSQSALAQHLTVMRDEGLVAHRREAQGLWYRITDPRCEALLASFHHIYCKPG